MNVIYTDWAPVDQAIQNGTIETVEQLAKACATRNISYQGFLYLEKRFWDKKRKS